MLIKPDCISCILKMAITAIRNLTSDEAVIQDLTVRILTIPSLRGLQWDLSSPEVIEQVMEKIITAFQNPDPFQALKREQNRVGQSLYPTLKKLVQQADDPLQAAVKMAIMGNAIDLMISDHPLDLEKMLVQGLEQPWPEKPFAAFKKKLEQTRSLVYLGDNCGEIVFDKLLLEIIRETYHPQVVFVVRSVPALNDATQSEAEMVGLDQVAVHYAQRVDGPGPGHHSIPMFRRVKGIDPAGRSGHFQGRRQFRRPGRRKGLGRGYIVYAAVQMHPLLPVFSNRNVSTDPGQFLCLLIRKLPRYGPTALSRLIPSQNDADYFWL